MNKVGIVLPLKETFSKKSAGAVSIWVKDYLSCSKFKKNIFVFASETKEQSFFQQNVYKVKTSKKYFTNTVYIKNVYEKIKNLNLDTIEIHNRPEYVIFLSKKNPNLKINLIFHNDPNKLRGSISRFQKIKILEKCNKVIFVSKFIKQKFFENLNFKHSNKTLIVYNSISKIKKFPKKENIIIFSGKLNSLKGYDTFGDAIIKILNKNKNWKAFVFGNEPREKYNFSHQRLFIKNWISHESLLKFYEKSSISVVIPKWKEPFGRTAMESAARGCAVITSKSGGLQETFINNLILKNNISKELENKIQKLIDDKKYLKKIQLFNFKNVLHDINITTKLIDNLYFSKDSNITDQNENLRILQISNYGEKHDHRIYNLSISKKISNGLIRNNHDVINFDYRDYRKSYIQNSLDQKILNICKNYKPKLVILGHNNSLLRETILKIKKNNCKIVIWYEDALAVGGPDYKNSVKLLEKNNDLIDSYFVTTHPSSIKTSINKKKMFYLPIPVDPNIEYGRFYNSKKEDDIFFALSHGVNIGKLKKGYIDNRQIFIDDLVNKSQNKIKLNILGLYNQQPKWNFDYDRELEKSLFALNLSRGIPAKYYSSNRIAQLMGNGCAVLIDKRVGYNDFFSKNEIITYDNLNDIVKKVSKLKKNKNLIKKIGFNAKKKYFKLFSNKIVSQYIIDKTFNLKNKFKYCWD